MDNLEEVLEKARQLDETALSTLIKQYYPVIFRFLYYRVNVREDAEDLTSEAFVRLVRSIKTQKGNFKAWFFRIARNLLIDYYRKRGRVKETHLDDLNAEVLADHNKDIRNLLRPEEIRSMLRFLTNEQKEVITLKFIEGHSNDEAAQIMNKSVGAVKVLQFRALARLKDVLKREG